MRKQELKSRKKVHSRKRRKRSSPTYRRKQIIFERYRPEVVTLEDARA